MDNVPMDEDQGDKTTLGDADDLEFAHESRPLRKEARLRELVALTVAEGTIAVDVLAERLGVSTMTVYRDVAELESDGLVLRTRGTVSAAPSTLVESSSRLRLASNTQIKARLARGALAYIHRGNSVILDDSSTGLSLFPALFDLSPLTLITNARFIADRAVEDQRIHLVSTGGDYAGWADAYLGPLTSRMLSELRADVCVMSAAAIHDGSCFHPDALVAQTKRAMLRAARTRVLMVDHTKFTRSALHRVGPITDFTVVITDSGTSPQDVLAIRDLGVEVIIVD